MSIKLEGRAANLVPADSFRGKKAVDAAGHSYGRVEHVHIDQDDLSVTGVTIHYGFHKDYYLPREFIARFTDETLLLSRAPIRRGVGVTDVDGHRLGSVKSLNRNAETGELESITVSHGLLFSKVVHKSSIWGVGEKVALRLTRAQFRAIR